MKTRPCKLRQKDGFQFLSIFHSFRWPSLAFLSLGVILTAALSYLFGNKWISLVRENFPGKTNWDYLETIVIPFITSVGVAYGVWWLNHNAELRQEKLTKEQKESEAVAEYIKEMTPLLLDKGLRDATKGDPVVGVARALILATLSRLSSVNAPARRTIIFRYLIDAGISDTSGLYILPEADLRGANLMRANFRGANFSYADLRGVNFEAADLSHVNFFSADLRGAILKSASLCGANLERSKLCSANFYGADMRHASLKEADLRGANFRGANLNESNFTLVKWDYASQWPDPSRLQAAQGIPKKLREYMSLF